MPETTPTTAAIPSKEVKLNLPKPFSGKRTELRRFLQDVIVYLTINKEIYDNDDKKIAFTVSFMNDGDAAAWKEEFIFRAIEDSDKRGDDISFGTFQAFKDSLENSFSPYDAPGDALEEIRKLRSGETSMDEHIAKFKILVTQSGLPESAAVIDFFRETLPVPLQRQILCCDSPPTTLSGWYDKASRFHNNYKRMQRILGRRTDTKTTINNSNASAPKRFTFPRKEKDPNAMDVDRLTIEERTLLMKEGKCFRCRKQGHLSRDCPDPLDQQKWTSKTAATHI